jgi:hypothetical protein
LVLFLVLVLPSGRALVQVLVEDRLWESDIIGLRAWFWPALRAILLCRGLSHILPGNPSRSSLSYVQTENHLLVYPVCSTWTT